MPEGSTDPVSLSKCGRRLLHGPYALARKPNVRFRHAKNVNVNGFKPGCHDGASQAHLDGTLVRISLDAGADVVTISTEVHLGLRVWLTQCQ